MVEEAPDALNQVDYDFFLETLVSIVNRTPEDQEVYLGMTLTVGGLLITGQLTSGRQYFLETAKSLASGIGEDDVRQDVERTFAKFAQIYDQLEGGEDEPPMSYIHLKNVRYAVPGQQMLPQDNRGVWWRGRLSEVAGFTLGTLEESPG